MQQDKSELDLEVQMKHDFALLSTLIIRECAEWYSCQQQHHTKKKTEGKNQKNIQLNKINKWNN